MITRVFVALDYLADTPEIFEQALIIAEQFQANLHIFHCAEPQTLSYPEVGALTAYGGMLDPTMIASQEKQFQNSLTEMSAWLDALATKAQSRSVPVEAKYKIGEPGQEICNTAKEWNADLILVGRRGLSGISEMLVGSVSSYVVHHAPCSVMVVQYPPS